MWEEADKDKRRSRKPQLQYRILYSTFSFRNGAAHLSLGQKLKLIKIQKKLVPGPGFG